MSGDLAVQSPGGALVITDADAPLPVFSGATMGRAFTAYRELQSALDQAMPDQIMKIGDRQFRKKGYWRAVRVAFGLTVKATEERREVAGTFDDGHENFGYLVTYSASAPNGRQVEGDGACFASEKAGKFRCPHPHPDREGYTLHYPGERCPDFDPGYVWRELPAQATEHNVRSHAHTRAFNRAVSNLVGFGEVSAEEVDPDEPGEPRAVGMPRRAANPSTGSPGGGRTITDAQQKRLYAKARAGGWADDEIKALIKRHGFEHVHEISMSKYDAVIAEIEGGTGGGGGGGSTAAE